MTELAPIHLQGTFHQTWSSYSMAGIQNLSPSLAVRGHPRVAMALPQVTGVGKAISEKERRMDATARETEDLGNSSGPLPELVRLFCALPFKHS